MQPMSISIAAKGDYTGTPCQRNIDVREANNSDEKSFGAQMRYDDTLTSLLFSLAKRFMIKRR
jgi:hypothetical protein